MKPIIIILFTFLNSVFANTILEIPQWTTKAHQYGKTIDTIKIKSYNSSENINTEFKSIGNSSRSCEFKPFQIKINRKLPRKTKNKLYTFILNKRLHKTTEIRVYPQCDDEHNLNNFNAIFELARFLAPKRTPHSTIQEIRFSAGSKKVDREALFSQSIKDLAKSNRHLHLSKSYLSDALNENLIKLLEVSKDEVFNYVVNQSLLGNLAWDINTYENIPIVTNNNKFLFYNFDFMDSLIHFKTNISKKIYKINFHEQPFLHTTYNFIFKKPMSCDQQRSINTIKENKLKKLKRFKPKDKETLDFLSALREKNYTIFNTSPSSKIKSSISQRWSKAISKSFNEIDYNENTKQFGTSDTLFLNQLFSVIKNENLSCNTAKLQKDFLFSFYLLSKINLIKCNLHPSFKEDFDKLNLIKSILVNCLNKSSKNSNELRDLTIRNNEIYNYLIINGNSEPKN